MWTYNTTPSYELYHYGVKGMKWGVRKKFNPSTRVTSFKKDNYTSNFNRKNNNKKPRVNEINVHTGFAVYKKPIVNEINVHTGFAVYKKHAKKGVSLLSDEASDFINEGKKRARSLGYLY